MRRERHARDERALRALVWALGLGLALEASVGCGAAPAGGTAGGTTGPAGAAIAGGTAGGSAAGSGAPAGTGLPRHSGAAVVLPGGAPARPSGPLLDASAMLSAEDVSAATGFATTLLAARLAGIAQSASYDSLHLRPAAPGSGHGVAVQVWRFATLAAARAAYDRDLARYVAARPANEIGDASFRAFRSGIQYVHFLVGAAPAVVSLTCGIEVCSPAAAAAPGTTLESLRWDGALALARKAAGRVPAAP